MNARNLSFMALGAMILSLAGCFLAWLDVGNQSLFDLAVEVGALKERSLTIVKGSLGVLSAMAAYLAWTFRAAPMRKYAQLMMLFGVAMIVILGTAWPWGRAVDAGIKPGVGLILCATASVAFLIISVVAFFSLKQTIQSWKDKV